MTYKNFRSCIHSMLNQDTRKQGALMLQAPSPAAPTNAMRNVVCIGLLSICVTMSGCANIAGVFAKQNTPVNSQPSNLSQGTAEQSVAESLNPELSAASERATAAALEVSQEREQMLALINAPNRFAQSKSLATGPTKSLLMRALKAYQSKQFDRALSFVDQAKAKHGPLTSAAYVLLGDIYIAVTKPYSQVDAMADDHEETLALAKQSYDNALSLNPQNYKAANRRALLHREQGEFTQALQLYNNAINAYPGHAVSYRNRGVLYDLYMGNKVAALDDYRKYSAILTFQQAYLAQIEPALGVLLDPKIANEFDEPSLLKRELRRVNAWQLDIERQIKAASKTSATRQTFESQTGSL